MRKVIKIVSIVLALFSLGLFILGILLRRNGLILNYEFWSGIHSYWIEFGFFGLFSFIFLMMRFEIKSVRIGLSVFAFFSCMLLGLFALLDTENITTIENEGYTVYVSSYYFLKGGTDTVYQKQNILLSKYVDEFTTDESYSPTYEVDNDILIVTTIYNSGNVEVEEYRLD